MTFLECEILTILREDLEKSENLGIDITEEEFVKGRICLDKVEYWRYDETQDGEPVVSVQINGHHVVLHCTVEEFDQIMKCIHCGTVTKEELLKIKL